MSVERKKEPSSIPVRLVSVSKFHTFSKPSLSHISCCSYFTFAMSAKTVKVSNLSLKASQRDVKEFFSFSGDLVYVEVQCNDDNSSQNAFVTFADSQGAETAVLLSGATIIDTTVTVTLAPEYHLPPEAAAALAPRGGNTYTPAKGEPESALSKAEDVVSSLFAKAKSFDQQHGITQKVSTGTSMVTEKVKEVDQKLQVSEKAKSAFAAAEQTVSNAGSAIMKNSYVNTSVTWVTSAVDKLVKTASEVGQQTKEKVGKTEHENKQKMVDDFAQVYLAESPKASGQTESPKGPGPNESPKGSGSPELKPAVVQGLVL
ncbi:putative RNA recognition motif domain, nucleotide-binding alpha-beta plait domain superfamily [Helianthus annuus]|uniref:Putative nucleotide-binding alpha-beta plait domain-containing protein n=1 Tax=Helianthus annuus TaxID=4232 RepID=A0A251VGN5_HELAN|nr:binding partner of ACD11 1 [Helianthus annuus]KAF5819080.1 putative RNA recognition motif domain, nucleotide-binding alpha-beta plait domain superfamily [Helianthus annuus]